MTSSPTELAERIRIAQHLFASIHVGFEHPGTERGGCPRHGMKPVYTRKLGEHAEAIFPNLTTVETSFEPEQFQAVMATLLLLKGWITGKDGQPTFAERIVEHYLRDTKPYFALALLKATEATIDELLKENPAHAPVLDALFLVAGGEGLRDLICFYDARTLEQISTAAPDQFPDILAFVHIHERSERNKAGDWEEQRYEVWCPGFDLAKEYHQQCLQAAQTLITAHGVHYVPDYQDEAAQLPKQMVEHLNRFVRTRTAQILAQYAL